MRSRDVLILTAVVALVGVGAALRTNRERAPAAAVPAQAATARPTTVPAAARLPRMVDLGAGRCIPCRKMAPILAALRTEYAGRAEIVFIDVWEHPELAEGYSFQVIPTQIFYDPAGREVWRHEGFLDRPEIVAQLRHLGVN
jgi:thioredoxin 1